MNNGLQIIDFPFFISGGNEANAFMFADSTRFGYLYAAGISTLSNVTTVGIYFCAKMFENCNQFGCSTVPALPKVTCTGTPIYATQNAYYHMFYNINSCGGMAGTIANLTATCQGTAPAGMSGTTSQVFTGSTPFSDYSTYSGNSAYSSWF